MDLPFLVEWVLNASLNLNGGSKPKAKEFSIKKEFHDHKWIFMAFTSDFVKDEEMSFFKEFTSDLYASLKCHSFCYSKNRAV